jgi:hypothetical protein
MAFDKNVSVKPIKFGTIDYTFDERGSSFLALRQIQWCKEGDEPDESKSKLELRKWMVDKDGNEIANKGFSFLTDDGPHELAKILVQQGYGKTKDILTELVKREDFKNSVENFGKEEDSGNGDFFDIRELLQNLEIDEEGA